MDIKIYKQLPKDAMFIREQVFMREQGFINEFDEIDDVAKGLVVYEGKTPVGTCRFFYSKERKKYIIGRVAVLIKYRGRNLGSIILKAAEEEIITRLRCPLPL